jgi:hypothetical protein
MAGGHAGGSGAEAELQRSALFFAFAIWSLGGEAMARPRANSARTGERRRRS